MFTDLIMLLQCRFLFNEKYDLGGDEEPNSEIYHLLNGTLVVKIFADNAIYIRYLLSYYFKNHKTGYEMSPTNICTRGSFAHVSKWQIVIIIG